MACEKVGREIHEIAEAAERALARLFHGRIPCFGVFIVPVINPPGGNMQQVQITVRINVSTPPPPPPPALVAAQLDVSLPTVDPGQVLAPQQFDMVSGGTPPYRVLSSGPKLPAGLSFAVDAQGNVTASGTIDPAVSPGSYLDILTIQDSGQ